MQKTVMLNQKGLTTEEAKNLQIKFGRNEFKKEQKRTLKIFLTNFFNALSIVLFLVSIITYILDDHISAIIIILLILINGIIGFYQEYKSEKATEKLIEHITYYCKVKRDEVWGQLRIEELVPGDVVRIEMGDRVPADLEMYKTNQILIDESMISGESYPVNKESGVSKNNSNKAFMGTIVSEGAGEGIVIGTGEKTTFGKTIALLSQTHNESTFERNLDSMSKTLIKVIILSVVLIFLINAFIGKNLIESLLFAAALAIGLVPEALSVIVTITLSKSALVLSKYGVIVKRLSAIEDLGNVDILCTDKTGTLTENNVVVKDSINLTGKVDDQILEYACFCIAPGHSNPIDMALVRHKNSQNAEILSLVEFDYERRRMSVVAKSEDSLIMITKGSPEEVIKVSTLNSKERKKAIDQFHAIGNEGLRAIAIAVKKVKKSSITKDDEKDMELLGFVTFFDPPKKTVKSILDVARRLNLKIKLMTGDNLMVAKHIAKEVGFEFTGDQAITGDDLQEIIDGKDEELIRAKIENTILFTRVSPVQKYLITKKLREYGHSVAFLGDGVNDAPAIKEADVGISVNNGSDVTKEAADIILLKKSLNAVVQGISGGRKTFSNIVKYITNTLAGNFGDLYTIGAASAFIPFIPLTPVQLLLANFITDAPMIAISTDNVDDEELIKPKKWDIIGIVKIGAIFGVISTIFDLLVILYFHDKGEAVFRTALFLEILLSEVIVILSLRSYRPMYHAEPLSNPILGAIGFTIIAGMGLVYSGYGHLVGFEPLSTTHLMVLVGVVLGYLIATEIVKNIYVKMFRRETRVDENALDTLRRKIAPELH